MSEPNFHYFLTGLPSVQSLVAGRVYPDKLRDATALPAVVFQRTGGDRQSKMCGTDGLVLGHWQIDVYGKTRQEVRELSKRIIGSGRNGSTPPDAMLDYKGMMGAGATACFVKNCSLTTDFDTVDPEPGLHRRTQLWDIWYIERD